MDINQRYKVLLNINNGIAHTMGNVTDTYITFINSIFPKGFIKKSVVTTKLYENELVKDDLLNKSDNPKLSVTPTMEFNQDIQPFHYSFHYLDRYLTDKLHREQSLIKVFRNDEDDITMYNGFNRPTFKFETKIRVNSNIQMINAYYNLQTKFRVGSKFFLNKMIMQSKIPYGLIDSIYKYKGFKTKKELNDYLTKYSIGNIINTKCLSSGQDCYYYQYLANILVEIDDISQGDVNKSGNIDKDAEINMQINMTLNTPNTFFLELPNYEMGEEEQYQPIVEYEDYAILNFSCKTKPSQTLVDGKVRALFEGFITADTEKDTINILEWLDESDYLPIINHIINNNDYNIFDYLEIHIYEGSDRFTGFSSDNKLNITLYNYLHNYNYYLAVYVDKLKLTQYQDKYMKNIKYGDGFIKNIVKDGE